MKIEMDNKEGVTLKTAGKYCAEDIEVIPTFEIGGGGSAEVQLFAPTIEVEGNQLGIANVNGNFASEWQLYANDTLKATLTERTADLTTIFDEQGEYLIKVIALGEVLFPSDYSNELTYWRRFYTVGLEYSISSNSTYAICEGIGTATDTDIVIAPEYEGLPVTHIGEDAFESSNITSLVIPESVTNINYGAFSSCLSLTSVVIPDSVTHIRSYVFSNCDALESVNYLGTIDQWAEGITFYHGVLNGRQLKINGEVVTEVILTTVTKISGNAFNGCTSLTSIELSDNVTSIGSDAFKRTNITSIEIPDSVTSIGDLAFSYCKSLTNIQVNENNANYKSIDGNLYSKDGTTLIQYAIGKTQTSIELPNSVTSIGDSAFSGCESLISVELSDSVTSIGGYAFSGCTALISIVFGNGITSIGDYVFNNCSALKLVDFRSATAVPTVGSGIFYNTSTNRRIVVPDALYDEWIVATNWVSYADYIIKASEYTG